MKRGSSDSNLTFTECTVEGGEAWASGGVSGASMLWPTGEEDSGAESDLASNLWASSIRELKAEGEKRAAWSWAEARSLP